MAADTNMFERITQRIAEKVFDRNKFHYDEPVHRELMRTMTAQITTAIKELAEHIPEQRALVPLCGRLVIVYTGICEAKFDTVVNYIQKDEKGFALSKTLTKLSVEKCVALYKQYMEGNYNYTKANQPATATSDSQDKTAGKASPKPKTKRTPSQTTAKRMCPQSKRATQSHCVILQAHGMHAKDRDCKSEKSEAASAKPETPSTAKKEAPPPKKAKPRSMSARGSKAQGYTEGEADVIGIVRINEDEEDDQTFGQFSVAARSNVKADRSVFNRIGTWFVLSKSNPH
ncbi:uncharacterized protein MONBRDRAFT_30736 [Monosiga brevicollis MX1]|uniref:Uncharacterized protein n=1 Tax=Monosiga brevicollis TaxID=81824 RepID=A9UNW3_MONBE|nr:uncharacterized protein MONBRDRAFT_30736 [Monosiga brevicollis MX1]EDQ92315.1 predicted protein [Monosiga brevicollis MX1]|eukprot:XP_001742077.1 hypothetical protein [Monosiga brevicollis MX1]